MAKDYFLYQVNKRWYRIYWAFLTSTEIAIVGIYILSQFSTTVAHFGGTLNIDYPAAIFAGASLFYLGIVFWAISKYSTPFATLIGSALFAISVADGLSGTVTEQATLIYVLLWIISIFFCGTYGLPILAGSVFVTVFYAFVNSNFNIVNFSQASWILVIGSSLMAVLSYFLWRRHFISIEAQKVTQLSGMLQSNQQQSEILIQSIADGVIVTNIEGKITLINPAASAMTEWPVSEALGVDAELVAKLSQENGQEIVKPENPFVSVLSEQKHAIQTLQLTGRKGKTQIISLVISPVVNPNDNSTVGAVAVMRDISEQRIAEKQRADFISTASHEMRTPVAAIEGYLALALNEKVSTIDSRARGYLEKAHISTQHLGQLFQDLLTSSKAEDGRLSNHPQVVEMGAFLQQLTDDLKFTAEKKGLFVEFLVGASTDAIDATNKDSVSTHVVKPLYYVYTDPDRLREVITNIFDNACKYTEQGKISLGLTGDNDVVQVYVRDTGAGIPAEDIPHLFQKFYRVDNSATRTIGGTGLGLFISRKIIELYKGRIWVESEIGKGSTFFINLPRLSTQRAQSLQAVDATKTA